jgi:hypothetical protein
MAMDAIETVIKVETASVEKIEILTEAPENKKLKKRV